MSFADWDTQELEQVEEGLIPIGWLCVGSPSTDDAGLLKDISTEVRSHISAGTLTDAVVERLAWQAHDILWPYVGGAEYRAAVVTDLYSRAPLFTPLVPLLDEATLAYFRGYSTVALAGFFVLLERYLRALIGWKPGDPSVSFSDLRDKALDRFPDTAYRKRAHRLLQGVYSHYNSLNPTPFFFNRHGLLHGLRGPHTLDSMNCNRMFVLLDQIVSVEAGRGHTGYIWSAELETRLSLYKNCVNLGAEREFLGKLRG